MRAFNPSLVPIDVAALTPPLRVCMMVTYDLASVGGGVKQHAVHLASSLRRAGDEVTLVGPSSQPSDDPDVKTFGGIVNVPNNGSDNMLGLLVSPRAVAAFFREHRFDVIHVHEPLNPTLSYWAVWATRHLPHVATFHAYAEAEPNVLQWARKASGTTIFPFFQRAIAVSEPAARYAARAWRGPMSIIPNGVSSRTFTPGSPRRAEPTRLLFVGRLGDRRKGARFLFDAYRNLLAAGHAVTLDVVGELGGAPTPPTLPGLRYHGAVANTRLAELYRQCDIFVAPSTGQESFGIVLLEAMASGKPVVCSDIDGYREVARGTSAVLVPPGDARSLEVALAYLLQLDRTALARMGALNRPVAETFDWDRIADRVRAEYVAAIRAVETVPPR